MPHTDDLTKPDCGLCQRFFKDFVLPAARAGKPPCAVLPDDQKIRSYCSIWRSKVNTDVATSFARFIEGVLEDEGGLSGIGKDPACVDSLAMDICTEMGKCAHTLCEACQDKVGTAAGAAQHAFDGFSAVVQDLATMCRDANDPDSSMVQSKLRASAARFEGQRGESRALLGDENLVTTGQGANADKVAACLTVSNEAHAKRALEDTGIAWDGRAKPDDTMLFNFCKRQGFCSDTDKRFDISAASPTAATATATAASTTIGSRPTSRERAATSSAAKLRRTASKRPSTATKWTRPRRKSPPL